jgi:hypothetical protein
MLSPYNITKKSADARFFGPFHKFFLFKKNVQNRKNVRKIAFFPFFLMLCAAFSIISVLYKMLINIHIILKIKNLKKTKNNILKLFLKNENWTFIFVHISKLKKSFKKIKIFSVFFQSPKFAFLVFQSTKYCFLGDVF